MSIEIGFYKKYTSSAVKHFWVTRDSATKKNKEEGKADQGNRGAVTAGKNMDGFLELIKKTVESNGLEASCVLTDGRTNLTLPGFFRPTKNWDVLVIDGENLIAVIEFKSQVGSFGNNFNNRCEEALGSATDFNVAFREKVFGKNFKPYLGYLMLVESNPKSVAPVRCSSPHFSVLEEFEGTSYIERYQIFCEKLVREGLYDNAALICSDYETGLKGKYTEPNEFNSVKNLISGLAAAVSAYVASK
ncbi:MAG: restriction endonuclease [Halobacteriovorax sp.]|nr:restriction endonuclease [Halobacteriovorax sp.]|tara:strand:+ start:15894 stop:16631 length:738 start_codon:yes stop_codon:yes gene_type:complete